MSIDKLGKLNYDSASKFSIQLTNTASVSDGADGSTALFTPTEEILNIALKNVAMVTYSDASVETYVGDHYVIARGREDIKEVTLTFNDYGSLTLYKAFEKFYKESQNLYPKDQYFNLTIFHTNGIATTDEKSKDKRKSTANKTKPQSEQKITTITLNNCILTAISALEFNHSTQNEILDFSVGLKCGDPDYQ